MMRIALLAALGAACCPAQTTAPRRQFEVAVIKPSKAGDSSTHSSWSNGRVTMQNLNVKQIIERAYGLQDYQISGAPGWLDTERYDIQAKAEERVPTEQLRVMLQALLADRFRLESHLETKTVPAYALVIAKSGLKMKPVDGEGHDMSSNNTKLTARHSSMQNLADFLARRLDRPVVDETGVKESFDFTLEWSNERMQRAEAERGAPEGPTIFTALPEQLGVKLEARKAPVDILVIDRVERPSEN